MSNRKIQRSRAFLLAVVAASFTMPAIGLGSGRAPHVTAEQYYRSAKLYLDPYADEFNPTKARDALQKAIQLKPDFAEAYCKLGSAYHWEHLPRFDGPPSNSKEEIEAYEEAIRVKPDFAPAYVELGKTYLTYIGLAPSTEQEPLMRRAAQLYFRALEVDPRCAEAYYELAELYFLKEDYDGSLREIWKALSVDLAFPSHHQALLWGLGYEQGRHDDVIPLYKAAINLGHNVAANLRLLGDAYCDLRDYDAALRSYEESILVDKDDTFGTRKRIADVYLAVGNKGAALTEGFRLKGDAEARTNFLESLFKSWAAESIIYNAEK